MSRSTIDFGIDLGTTNSAIALLREDTTTEIIKNKDGSDTTPSAVHIDKRGRLHVGTRAKNRLGEEEHEDDVYIEVKRAMGTDQLYSFRSCGRKGSPEELSAEILKSLKDNVRSSKGEEVQACVITIPAAFEQRQCMATIEAAKFAGFVQSPLLQEPVAAALAYGFQESGGKGYTLVYDFGGGTFDAAVMKTEDGIVQIVNHGGDNYLGGTDIDNVIVDQIVVPELLKNFNLIDFRSGNPVWSHAFRRLKRSVEAAKIELSYGIDSSSRMEDCIFHDSDGNLVDFDLDLQYRAVASLVEPLVLRSVQICRHTLEECGLSSSAIEKMILVGGPTLAPYFREILSAELGIPLEFSIDQMTVVARGAAVFAGTQRVAAKPTVAVGSYVLDLKYEPVGADNDPSVQGTVRSSQGNVPKGLTIEFFNPKSRYSSGQIAVSEDGRFKTTLRAEPAFRNEFEISLKDAKGAPQEVSPNTMHYTIGTTITAQTLQNGLGIVTMNNELLPFFPKGAALPSKKTAIRHTGRTLTKGESGEIVRIPVVEGDERVGDHNRYQGELVIEASSIRRDLPANSEMEITISINESREMRIEAYIPILDEVYETSLKLDNSTRSADELRKELDVERDRLRELNLKHKDTLGTRVGEVSDGQTIELLRVLNAADVDKGEARKAEHQLQELRIQLDHMEQRLSWPEQVRTAREDCDKLRELAEEHGTAQHRGIAAELNSEVEELIAQERRDALSRKVEEVNARIFDVLSSLPAFWVSMFKHTVSERARFSNPQLGERLIQEGHNAIEMNDFDGLRRAVAGLYSLLPEDVVSSIQGRTRAYGSDVL